MTSSLQTPVLQIIYMDLFLNIFRRLPTYYCFKSFCICWHEVCFTGSECINGTAEEYIGRRICTDTGKICRRWDNQTAWSHPFTDDSMFPEKISQMQKTTAGILMEPEDHRGVTQRIVVTNGNFVTFQNA